jgi:hypothetical protein
MLHAKAVFHSLSEASQQNNKFYYKFSHEAKNRKNIDHTEIFEGSRGWRYDD